MQHPFEVILVPLRPPHRRALLACLSGLLAVGLPMAHGEAVRPADPAVAAPAASAVASAPTPRSKGQSPLFFEADQISGEAGVLTRAAGQVRLVQNELLMRADNVTHTVGNNTVQASGQVRIRQGGNVFAGPSLSMQLDTEQGEFVSPRFWLSKTQAGGSAERIDFLGQNRLLARGTSYSSCTPANTADGQPGEPAWSLKTSQVYLDLDASEGRAENAVVWFLGAPILAFPRLSFPLDDSRKSGWLPPSFDYDSKSGFELSVPYYWNIAPNQDMTLVPQLSTRRGFGLDTEYRYLLPQDSGSWRLVGLPEDRVSLRERGLADLRHLGHIEGSGLKAIKSLQSSRTDYELRWLRVSDDDYWKDFSHNLPTLTPRLYDSHARFEHMLSASKWGLGESQTQAYGSVQTWQTLKDLDPDADPELSQLIAPYRRTPQLGLRSSSTTNQGLNWTVAGEFNRFTHADASLVSGNRVLVQGQISKAYTLGGWSLTPKAALRSTSYDLDQALANGRRNATRTVPSFSLDSGTVLERPVHWFGRDLTQTLEPRLQYVRTAYRDQSGLPLFDTAPRDFNQYAIFSENAFAGGDRVNDANQVTLGLSTRLLDQQSGAEAMRLGLVQKVLLADQRINPDGDTPITERLSDLLLLGSTSVHANWSLDGSAQFAAQNHALQRGLLGLRYSPAPWRVLGLNYRYTRDASEQVELGWQWPVWGAAPRSSDSQAVADTRQLALSDPLDLSGRRTSRQDCSGTWYSVGRLSYSARDSKLTEALAGVEYDAGCWIGRVVAQRKTVGQESSTRVMVQLELVGLSRISLGSNPLKALKDNIPGYRLLRDDGQVNTNAGSSPLLEDE
jgi:LPS-assembly protein